MNEEPHIYLIIIGMAAVTYFSRELPFFILKGKKLNEKIVKWLSFIPASVIAALLTPELFITETGGFLALDFSFNNLYLWAGAAAFAAGYLTKNFFITIIFGIGLLAAVRYVTQ